MAAAEVERPLPVEEPAPAVPDYLASPNAVFEDKDVQWRYGTPPDYSKTRAVWEKTKTMNHTAGSLPQLVENLVKNWEVEASFKPRLQDWRTIDHENYSFAINGGPPQTAEHMLKVGTYNAIVAPNEYYSPEHTDFAASHKTFKRMMPTFAWEVLEVYSGPPKVAFRWRHWGEMKSDYIAFNNKGEKITAKAHGGKIDIEGVTVAEVDDKVRLRKVETWFDPMEMFRQIAPKGIVNKEIVDEKIGQEEPALTDSQDTLTTGATTGPMQTHIDTPKAVSDVHAPADQLVPSSIPPQAVLPKEISPSTGLAADAFVPHQGTADFSTAKAEESTIYTSTIGQQSEPNAHRVPGAFEEASYHDSGAVSDGSDKTWEKVERPLEANESLRDATVTQPSKKVEGLVDEQPAGQIQPLQHGEVEDKVKPAAGEAVAAAPTSHETRMTHEEMSRISATECPFLMNRE